LVVSLASLACSSFSEFGWVRVRPEKRLRGIQLSGPVRVTMLVAGGGKMRGEGPSVPARACPF